jgi:putative PIN family toxin of toxin-antitoxin system
MVSRVVIDTNVLVGAALSRSGGANREVLRACLKGSAKPVIGMALFSEYEDLFLRSDLMKKSPLTAKERLTLLEAFLSVCEWVRIYYLWRPNLPDESDNHLIELAIAGGAAIIVTNNLGDTTRGELEFPGLQILSPSQFLQIL